MLSRVLTFAVVAGLLSIPGFSQDKTKYGKELTLKETTKISSILQNPSKFKGKKVLVEGTIADVCQHQGCWIDIVEKEKAQTMRFKVEDGVIVFPPTAKGKKVLAEGVLSVKILSMQELIAQGKKHAEEEGKEFDPSTVKGPKTVVQIEGEGAIIH